MSLCEDCFRGVEHEGTPAGKIETIGGVRSYVATPSGEYAKEKVLLLLTDVFGLELVNGQLLADGFAANGFKTVMPDYLHGDPIPVEYMTAKTPFDTDAWFKTHGPGDTRPLLEAVIAALRAEGVTTFGATGYCFGGKYAIDLARENVTKAIAISHPGLLELPADFETLKAQSSNPLLINSCETDFTFGPENQKIADDVLGGGQYAPGYTREYFLGCKHGFAIRGDLSDPVVKAGKEGAFKATVNFFLEHL